MLCVLLLCSVHFVSFPILLKAVICFGLNGGRKHQIWHRNDLVNFMLNSL